MRHRQIAIGNLVGQIEQSGDLLLPIARRGQMGRNAAAEEIGRVGLAIEPNRSLSEALCRERAPRSTFTWLEPPRNVGEIKPEPYPLLDEPDLLSDPNAVLEQEESLLQPAPTAPAQPGASSD